MDNELKKALDLIRSKGSTVNGSVTSSTFNNTTDSLENIRDELVVADAAIDAIQVDLGDMTDAATSDDLSNVTTTSALAKLRLILNRLATNAFSATIQGAARTELDAMLDQLATYFSAAGAAYSSTVNPGGSARTNIELVLEDIGDVLAGTGIVTYPSGAAPGNGISLAEALRYVSELTDSIESAGPYSYTDAGGEQNVVEDAITTRRHIWLEFSNRNMAQTGTFRIYRKVDGASYDLWVSEAVLVAAGSDRAFDAEFTTNQHWKLTYQENVDEAAARNIPYNIITRVIE